MSSRIQSFPIVGHRGAPMLVPPGNTLASFQRAIDVGAQMLEVDVRATHDGVLVTDHEAMRYYNGQEIPIYERTYREWQVELEDGGIPLPSLAEVFALVRQTGVGLMLDFKEPGTEALLARAIRQSGIPYERLLVAGADENSRKLLRGLDPHIPQSLTIDIEQGIPIDAKMLSELDMDVVTWHHKLLTPPIVKVLHLRKILVYAWTVNLTEEMRRLRDLCQVDGIITDSPDLLKAL